MHILKFWWRGLGSPSNPPKRGRGSSFYTNYLSKFWAALCPHRLEEGPAPWDEFLAESDLLKWSGTQWVYDYSEDPGEFE